jgi:hypothetical protein
MFERARRTDFLSARTELPGATSKRSAGDFGIADSPTGETKKRTPGKPGAGGEADQWRLSLVRASYEKRRCLYETLFLKSATLPTRRMLAHVPL